MCILSIFLHLTNRDTNIEEAVNLRYRPDMIIKLVSPEIMAKLLARNRRRTDPRITEEEIRALPNGCTRVLDMMAVEFCGRPG